MVVVHLGWVDLRGLLGEDVYGFNTSVTYGGRFGVWASYESYECPL